MDLQSTLVAAGVLPNVIVEPRGFEPRSQDFQSCAYTKSAKAPCYCWPFGLLPSHLGIKASSATLGLSSVAPDGIEPPLADPDSAALPLCNRAIFLRRLKDSNLWDVYRLLVFKTSAIDQLCQTSMVCDSWEIRTPDPDVRSVVLWSNWANEPNLAEAEGFEPSRPTRSSTLAEYRFRPLTHTSFLISSAKLRWLNAVFFRSWKNFQKNFKKMCFSWFLINYPYFRM